MFYKMIYQKKYKLTLLSAPVSSELPFCKTTLPRKELLVISPILFSLSKSGADPVLQSLGNQRVYKWQCF